MISQQRTWIKSTLHRTLFEMHVKERRSMITWDRGCENDDHRRQAEGRGARGSASEFPKALQSSGLWMNDESMTDALYDQSSHLNDDGRSDIVVNTEYTGVGRRGKKRGTPGRHDRLRTAAALTRSDWLCGSRYLSRTQMALQQITQQWRATEVRIERTSAQFLPTTLNNDEFVTGISLNKSKLNKYVVSLIYKQISQLLFYD